MPYKKDPIHEKEMNWKEAAEKRNTK